ncbi:MAG: ATP F0F1 synthase synthase [Methylobacter sp.]|nr:ATP F0F1 synthase synthase [Methylobacter sp.]
MDQVLAKVKGNGKKKFFKLLSDQTLFDDSLQGLGFVEYNPDHNLDEDSWFKVEQFSQQSYCMDLLTKDFASSEYDDLSKDKFTNIAYLCAVQGHGYYFQKITRSLFVTKKMIAFGEVVKLENDGGRLVINSTPDAIYQKNSDTLVFRNLATISSIFKGIDELYKEATQEEVGNFLDESFVELSGEYGVENVSKPNRKRVALAMSTLAAMPSDDRDQMLSYIDSYCQEKLKFDAENKKFEITSDEELKYLLYGIEQRFYTTPIGNEKRLANSVQTIG